MSARKHPRFLDARRVEVRLENREELREMWTEDISKGGMFISTDAPPSFGSILDIVLETPDGNVTLKAEVVHVLPPEQAQQIGYPAGVGVQFSSLSNDVRTQIERYVDQVAERLSSDASETALRLSAEELIEEGKTVMRQLADSKIYAALGVKPSASEAEIEARVAEIRERFSNPPPDMPPPQAARLSHVLRQVERAAKLFSDPMRRLHYDFRIGHIRFGERKAAGEDLRKLRKVWCTSRPEEAGRAKLLAEQAAHAQASGDIERAAVLASKALELDPFNEPLREAVTQWQRGLEVDLEEAPMPTGPPSSVNSSKPGTPPPNAPAKDSEPPPAEPESDPDEPPLIREVKDLIRRMGTLDHFELLDLKPTASEPEIQKAFVQKTRKFHPDGFAEHSDNVRILAGQVQARINEAYQVLRDAGRRQAYLKAQADKNKSEEQAAAERAALNCEMAKVHIRRASYSEARTLLKEALLSLIHI